jgi:hypothetical protein
MLDFVDPAVTRGRTKVGKARLGYANATTWALKQRMKFVESSHSFRNSSGNLAILAAIRRA